MNFIHVSDPSTTGGNQLLTHMQRHELHLWSLIEAQNELKSCIKGLAPQLTDAQLFNGLDHILRQYEAYIWQIVPVQLHLRLKVTELNIDAQLLDEVHEEKFVVEEVAVFEPEIIQLHTNDVSEYVDDIKYAVTAELANITDDDANSSYTCDECGEYFDQRPKLEEHKRQHMNAKPFACQLCDARFETTSLLFNHTRVHIAAGEQLKKVIQTCRLCQQQFKDKEKLQRHFVDSHAGERPYKCDECDASFTRSFTRDYHKRRIHGGQLERSFTCDVCQKAFTDIVNMRKHMNFSHRLPRVECNLCGKSLKNAGCLVKHMQVRHTTVERTFLCDECGKGFLNKPSLVQHMTTHTGERPFACTTCDYKSSSMAGLKNHMTTHSSERPFKCSECDKCFANKNNRLKHMQHWHAKEKPHACDHCDKTFVTRFKLTYHMRKHTGDKPYACTECNMKFGHSGQRNKHMQMVHTGERPFKCDICEEAFVIKHRLTVHMRQHTGIAPFPCDDCGKGFNSLKSLQEHQAIHHSQGPPQFICEVCQREFHTPTRLKSHMLVHTDERPFECELCSKAFKTAGDRTAHMRSHTDERRYACQLCDARFKDCGTLSRHRKKVHKLTKEKNV